MSSWFYPGQPYPALGPTSLVPAVTDCVLLSEVQRVTLEGAGDGGVVWPSGMWTAAEVLGYLNQRQNRFLAATALFWTRLETDLDLSQNDQEAPSDWAATVFIAYKHSDGTYRELPKMDAAELDLAVPTWPGTTTSGRPRGYYEVDGDTLTTYVVPAPTAVASALERYYVALATQTGACTPLAVSDEFAPTLKYGVLADMFNKLGPAHNPVLAQACEERWEEGLELGKLMAQEGWFVL